MSLLNSAHKKKGKKVKKGPYYYNSVKLKPGEKLWGLDVEKEWLEEVDVFQVKGGGKTYIQKKNHVYVVAKTIDMAAKKLTEEMHKALKKVKMPTPKMKGIE